MNRLPARVLVCFNNQSPAAEFNIAWLLHEPWLLCDADVQITALPTQRKQNRGEAVFPEKGLTGFDLVIVPHGASDGLLPEQEKALVEFLGSGGAV